MNEAKIMVKWDPRVYDIAECSHLITHMNMGLWEHKTKYSA